MNLQEISEQIRADIDQHCEKRYANTLPGRAHLGASEIGTKCIRQLWYKFRWAKRYNYSGRMHRLFDRGKKEEPRFSEWLSAIGFQFQPMIEHKEIINPHFGGQTDDIGIAPKYFPYPVILEKKTHNTKAFVHLSHTKSVALACPTHYAQMCVYGLAYEIEYGLYLAINKNDDDIYVELTKLDKPLAEELIRKAMFVIESTTPPKRISDNPAYFECKFCNFIEICHYNEMPEKNCRSCHFVSADDNGTWYCNYHCETIPNDFIPQGCDKWQPLTK